MAASSSATQSIRMIPSLAEGEEDLVEHLPARLGTVAMLGWMPPVEVGKTEETRLAGTRMIGAGTRMAETPIVVAACVSNRGADRPWICSHGMAQRGCHLSLEQRSIKIQPEMMEL
jgi:hypothetical protein